MQRLVQMIHLIGVTITPLLAALIDVNEADCFPIVAISTWGCWIHIGFASGFATASDGCVFPVSFLWRVAMQLDLNRTCGVIAQLRPSDTTVMRSLIQMNGNISFLVKLWSTVLPGASGHRSVKSAFIPFSIFFPLSSLSPSYRALTTISTASFHGQIFPIRRCDKTWEQHPFVWLSLKCDRYETDTKWRAWKLI